MQGALGIAIDHTSRGETSPYKIDDYVRVVLG